MADQLPPASEPMISPKTPDAASAHGAQPRPGRSWWARWHKSPLYLRILIGFALGIVAGLLLGDDAGPLEIPSKLVLRVLGALAPPLILLAVIHALMHADLPRGSAFKLVGLLLLNTLVAISIGLLVANLLQPGRWTKVEPRTTAVAETEKVDPLALFLDNVPRSLLGPFTDNGKVIAVIMLAVAFGIALRRMKHRPMNSVADAVEIGLNTLIVVLHWIIDVIPLAVFGIVASIIGTKGFADFLALAGFVVAVLLALLLHATYYLVRIRFGCWARPAYVLHGMRDAIVMAFSTASSTATMPVTYECLRERVGLRERSASLGALVGANFNNDGTALYEAMSALFVSQMLGQHLTLTQQLMVVLTSIVASVGAAGIPEAGLVTMTLVFNAVGLPVEYIAILLTVDWFLDRCRTAVNVMGDVNVSCMLDGKVRETRVEPALSASTSLEPQPVSN
jgi:DAACS family dicarboxylate/amino acid:cation (Na+ or H+) symporter